jgi:stage II sporulation protein D
MTVAPLRLLALITCAALAVGCARRPVPEPAPVPPAPAPRVPERAPDPVSAPVPTPPVTPAPEASFGGEEPWITVGLAWDLNGVTVDPEGAAVVQGAGRHALEREDQLSVTLERGRAAVRAVGRKVRWSATLAPGETLAVTPDEGTTIRWKDQQWRGQFRIFINPRGTLTLATRLRLERYLAGVVPGEIGALGEDVIEAGRAQAIAARSYTLFYRGRRAAEGFDVYSTVEDQLFVAVEGERPLASRCVESTAGEVALSQGQPVRANYSSTCGGITADVWEAWPADPLPYLVGGRDRPAGEPEGDDYCVASRHFRWREEWPAAELLDNLAEYGPPQGIRLPSGRPGALVDVRVESRSRSGRVWRLVVETTAGSVVIPAWSLRQVMRRPGNRAAILRSTLIKVDVRRDPRTDRVLSVVASGAGSGHGVGLCQTGALGMARRGRTGEEIVRHYYRGTEIRRLY